MKKIIVSFVTLLFVSCGESSKSPILNVPDYKLVSIESPKVSPNGYISPTQNLEYIIEIDHPMQKDSLELLQDYFINKGKEDYAGINKVIVRVFLKGTSAYGVPYASLILIGDNKNIDINEGAKKLDPVTEQATTTKEDSSKSSVEEVKDPLIGRYYCERSRDWYVFKSDNSGQFIMSGVPPTDITWKRKGNIVTVTFAYSDPVKLKYDEKKGTLEESSKEALEIYGTKLIFKKQ